MKKTPVKRARQSVGFRVQGQHAMASPPTHPHQAIAASISSPLLSTQVNLTGFNSKQLLPPSPFSCPQLPNFKTHAQGSTLEDTRP
eukprot:1157287-Pelagomonas_calceolata.AAC.2